VGSIPTASTISHAGRGRIFRPKALRRIEAGLRGLG